MSRKVWLTLIAVAYAKRVYPGYMHVWIAPLAGLDAIAHYHASRR